MKTTEVGCLRGAVKDEEAVIREARRRQRRRQFAMGVAVVLALAGTLGGFAAVNGHSHPRLNGTVSWPVHRLAPGSGALGIDATVLMWPVGFPAFGPGVGPPAYLSNLATGQLVQRQIPGIIGCDCRPYLIAVGRRLVYAGEHGTTSIAADLKGTLRVLGATQSFAPSAAPGHVWLIYQRSGAALARSVPVTGGPSGPAISLPRGTSLVEGTNAGLLLERRNGLLQIWNPGTAPVTLPHSANWTNGFASTARNVAYGTGCQIVETGTRIVETGTSTPSHERIGYDTCQKLRVFDVSTGRLASFRAPPGTAGWVPSGISGIGLDNAISPRNTMIAAGAVTSPREGQAHLFVLPLTGPDRMARAVPSSAAFFTAMTTWSADGSWLFYQGTGGHLWA